MGAPRSETKKGLADQQEFLRQQGIELRPPFSLIENPRILTPDALLFVADMERTFRGDREKLLARREEVQHEIDEGRVPDFLPETREIREDTWRVNAEIPWDLEDRRLEITGPVTRKMMINAMNSAKSGVKVFMADSEDSLSPTGTNIIAGQENLLDLVGRKISFDSPEGKHYELGEKTTTLMYRPRGWHLVDKHFLVDGKPVSASLLDAGLYLFHNARPLQAQGTGAYFYLPKMQDHREARLWNDFFVRAQKRLPGSPGDQPVTIRTTALIEHILAAFQMNEILYELRDFSAGLNCGRWDYLFSLIKTFRMHPEFMTPDRAQMTMSTPLMESYVRLLVDTCHRRGVHAMGGMSAYIPIKDNPQADAAAKEQVRQDKLLEVARRQDGTWIAHPGLAPVAKEPFDAYMKGPNQIAMPQERFVATAQDLLQMPTGTRTENGLRTNASVGIRYIASWLAGSGAVPINNLMEDAATAEICRTQVWQWIHYGASLEDGRMVNEELVRGIVQEEQEKAIVELGSENEQYVYQAGGLFQGLVENPACAEFLTIAAYALLE